jgi:3-oxoacyl-[acyl-carrier-protein] synthase-3
MTVPDLSPAPAPRPAGTGPLPQPVRVLGTGVHEPQVVVTSAELDVRHGRAPGTSAARSGVDSRRWAAPGETSSAMAASAVGRALAVAGLDVGDLDALIVSAVAPEQPMPTTAVLTLAALDAPGGRTEAFDVNASCVGFLTAFGIATAGIASGRWQRVAVVATEIASKGLDHADVEASALFGDGAAAVVLGPAGPGEPSGVLAARSATWPEAWRACRIEAGGTRFNPMTPPPDPGAYRFRMDGAVLLRHVARTVPGFLRDVERRAGITPDDVDVLVPHQASAVGLRYLRERTGVRAEAVVDVLADHGNQVSASVPTALHHAVASGRLRRGGTALLLGTGAGLTVSAVVLRY